MVCVLAGVIVMGAVVADRPARGAAGDRMGEPPLIGGFLDGEAFWPFGSGGAFLGTVMQKTTESIDVRSFDGRRTVRFFLPQDGEGHGKADGNGKAAGRDALATQIRITLVGDFVEIQWRVENDQPTLMAIIRAR